MPYENMVASNTWLEIGIRAGLGIMFLQLENSTPFMRKIHLDEIRQYKNPRTDDYVPVSILFPVIIIIPVFVIFINYLLTRDRSDISQGSLALTLGLGLNGVLTDMIKLLVGRPRPDFFWRCFPDGEMNTDMTCTGELKAELEGRKSFPSGHSSFSFAGMGFLAWYLMGKLKVFTFHGRGQSWRLIAALTPLICALMVAISRTCDYHHHWQDVVVGSIIGLSLSYLCYRQYYPPLSSMYCDRSYVTKSNEFRGSHAPTVSKAILTDITIETETNELSKLIEDEKNIKWI